MSRRGKLRRQAREAASARLLDENIFHFRANWQVVTLVGTKEFYRAFCGRLYNNQRTNPETRNCPECMRLMSHERGRGDGKVIGFIGKETRKPIYRECKLQRFEPPLGELE